MLAKSMFLRLCLVLAIPLFSLGWWVAENEVVLPHHSTITCIEQAEEFLCISETWDGKNANNVRHQVPITFGRDVFLPDGFSHKIIPHEFPSDGGIAKDQMKRGEEQLLSLPLQKVRGRSEPDFLRYCDVRPFAFVPDLWEYKCHDEREGVFDFADKQAKQKFINLQARVDVLSKQAREFEILAKTISVLAPFAAFLVLSFVFWALRWGIKFVMGPTSHKSA